MKCRQWIGPWKDLETKPAIFRCLSRVAERQFEIEDKDHFSGPTHQVVQDLKVKRKFHTVSMKLHLPSTLVGIFMLILVSMPSAVADDLLVSEHFERGGRGSDFQEHLENHKLLEIVRDEGVDGGRALRATYQGYKEGSRRIVEEFPLSESADEVSLSFDVNFEKDFDFTRGGKLHGIGPKNRVTGGKAMTKNGYSVRLMFGSKGGLKSYIYHQDQRGKYGDSKVASGFSFKRGRYYALTLHTKLNSTAEAKDGFVRVYVDGKLKIDHKGLRFRGSEDRDTLFSQLLFSTFHGGNTRAWAPQNADGSFATVHALFDNFAVYKGELIRAKPGRCW